MQFSIINEGRGGITLTATSKDDAALLARLPDTIVLTRNPDGYASGSLVKPEPVAKPKPAPHTKPQETATDE
jgi:hypothetical protein